jgi:hypothetical protein
MHQKIQAYKNNELTESEELKLEKNLFDQMIRQDYEQFVQNSGLSDLSHTAPPLQVKRGNTYFQPFLKAAVLLLMIGGAGYLFYSPTRSNPIADLETQVNQNLTLREELPQTRLDDKKEAEKRQIFQQAYRNQAFEKAAAAIQSMEPKYKDDFYYWGLCQLYLPEPQYVIAIQQLQKAADLGKEEAVWYLALAQIKLNDKRAARQSLQKYLDYGRTWKRNEAETLLKLL